MVQKICAECRSNVVWYEGIQFCKDCSVTVYGNKDETVYEIDRLVTRLVNKVAELENKEKPENYSQLIVDVRDYISKQIDKENDNELQGIT